MLKYVSSFGLSVGLDANTCIGLLRVADMYQMPDLFEVSVDLLRLLVSKDTIVDILHGLSLYRESVPIAAETFEEIMGWLRNDDNHALLEAVCTQSIPILRRSSPQVATSCVQTDGGDVAVNEQGKSDHSIDATAASRESASRDEDHRDDAPVQIFAEGIPEYVNSTDLHTASRELVGAVLDRATFLMSRLPQHSVDHAPSPSPETVIGDAAWGIEEVPAEINALEAAHVANLQ